MQTKIIWAHLRVANVRKKAESPRARGGVRPMRTNQRFSTTRERSNYVVCRPGCVLQDTAPPDDAVAADDHCRTFRTRMGGNNTETGGQPARWGWKFITTTSNGIIAPSLASWLSLTLSPRILTLIHVIGSFIFIWGKPIKHSSFSGYWFSDLNFKFDYNKKSAGRRKKRMSFEPW